MPKKNKLPKATNFPVVEIYWVDSYTSIGWFSYEEGESPNPFTVDGAKKEIRSIGFLLHEDDDTITISTSMSQSHAYISPLSIPKVAVTRYYQWKVKR